jgi:hypothetical protein
VAALPLEVDTENVLPRYLENPPSSSTGGSELVHAPDACTSPLESNYFAQNGKRASETSEKLASLQCWTIFQKNTGNRNQQFWSVQPEKLEKLELAER